MDLSPHAAIANHGGDDQEIARKSSRHRYDDRRLVNASRCDRDGREPRAGGGEDVDRADVGRVLQDDDAGNQLSATDANGKTSSMTFDKASNLLTRTDGAGGTTIFHYDSQEQLDWEKDEAEAQARQARLDRSQHAVA